MSNILFRFNDSLEGSIPEGDGSKISEALFQELDIWQGRKETDPAVYPSLAKYWQPIGIDWSPSGTPWSAAFISWVSKQGDSGFPASAAHWQYIEAVSGGEVPGWGAFSIPKNQGAVPLAVGDILIRPRGSGDPSSAEYWFTHGDIVGSIDGGFANLYGGNLSDTAKLAQRIAVDSDGIATGSIRDYVIILKRQKKRFPWIVILGALGIGGFLWTKRK